MSQTPAQALETREVKVQEPAAVVEKKIPDTSALETLPDAIPDGFECPILKDLMQDPVVTIADGHSYERDAIAAWFKTGKRVSPVTGQKLSTTLFVPNHNLRKAIQHFLREQPVLAKLKEQERQSKTREQLLQDLEIAIQLYAEELEAQRQKAELKESKTPVETLPNPDALKSAVAEFLKQTHQFIQGHAGSMRLSLAPQAAISYVGTVISVFAKPPEVLQNLLQEPELYSLPNPVARFMSQYLAQHPELHGLRQRVELTKEMRLMLNKASDLNAALISLGVAVSGSESAMTSSSSSSSTSTLASIQSAHEGSGAQSSATEPAVSPRR